MTAPGPAPKLTSDLDRGLVSEVDIRTPDQRLLSSHGKAHIVPGFRAQRGYDLVSGLGTIDAAQFAPELAKAAG